MKAINEIGKELPNFVLILEELRDEALFAGEDLLQEQVGEFTG